MVEVWYQGQAARIDLDTYNDGGTLADPGGLQLIVRAPSGTKTTYVFGTAAELVKDTVGRYHAYIIFTSPGLWRWRWEATAPHAGVDEGSQEVLKSRVL
jgi:hypothetical protein